MELRERERERKRKKERMFKKSLYHSTTEVYGDTS